MLRHPIFLWDLLGSLSPRPLLGEGALEVLEVLEDLENLDIKIKKNPQPGIFLSYHNLLVKRVAMAVAHGYNVYAAVKMLQRKCGMTTTDDCGGMHCLLTCH